eukprot:scaffold645_cov247-Pinguiococcus_pyrenoidosus.AAC.17
MRMVHSMKTVLPAKATLHTLMEILRSRMQRIQKYRRGLKYMYSLPKRRRKLTSSASFTSNGSDAPASGAFGPVITVSEPLLARMSWSRMMYSFFLLSSHATLKGKAMLYTRKNTIA